MTFRLLLAACLAAACLLTAPAAWALSPLDFVDVRISNISKDEVSALSAQGFIITSRLGDEARASVTREEMDFLTESDFELEILSAAPRKLDSPLAGDYPTYAEMTAELQQIAADNPGLCQLESIGQSNNGHDLWFMKISGNVAQEEDEPEFKYISTMHGNEPLGTVLMLRLINHLMDNYGTDPQASALVDGAEIWIMPLMNPDGYAVRSRTNANGYDLNRFFPDRIDDPKNDIVDYDGDPRPREVQLVMQWNFNHHPVLSANLHTGALLANYPYDGNEARQSVDTPTPDDDLFETLALTYSTLNPPMFNSPWYENGITNGADWYVVYGGMQDWNYVWMGCMEITLELSNTFAPDYSLMDDYWDDNRDSLLAYMEWCLRGVRGVVADVRTGAPLSATITAGDSDFKTHTDPDVGDYHRILLPGQYDVTISSPGYAAASFSGVTVTSGSATRLDVLLKRPDVDADNDVDLADAVILLQIAANLDPEFEPDLLADINNDGKLNMVETLWTLRFLAGF